MPTYKQLVKLLFVKEGRLHWKVKPSKNGNRFDRRADRYGHVTIGITIYKEKDLLKIINDKVI